MAARPDIVGLDPADAPDVGAMIVDWRQSRLTNPAKGSAWPEWRGNAGGGLVRLGILAETLQAPDCATGTPTTATFWPLFKRRDGTGLERRDCKTRTLYNFDPSLTGEKFSLVGYSAAYGWDIPVWVGCLPALNCGDGQCCGADESCEESSSGSGTGSSSMTSSSGSGSDTSSDSGLDTSSGSGSDTSSGSGSDTSSGSGSDTSSGSGSDTSSGSGSDTSSGTSSSSFDSSGPDDEPPGPEPPGVPPEDDPETNSHITPCCTGPSAVGHTLHLSGEEVFSGGPGGSVTGTLEWMYPTTSERLWRGDITFNSGSGAGSRVIEDAEFYCNGAGGFVLELPELGTSYIHCGGVCGPPLEVDFCAVDSGIGGANTFNVTVSD